MRGPASSTVSMWMAAGNSASRLFVYCTYDVVHDRPQKGMSSDIKCILRTFIELCMLGAIYVASKFAKNIANLYRWGIEYIVHRNTTGWDMACDDSNS
jgi:hypothetical protein